MNSELSRRGKVAKVKGQGVSGRSAIFICWGKSTTGERGVRSN